VEDHALHRHLGLEHLGQMPADALTLAIFIGGQNQLVGILELIAQLLDHLLLAAGHDIERIKILFDIDAKPRPRFTLILGRDLAGRCRQITNMAHAGLNVIAFGQEVADGFCFGRGFDNY
jgi:hypothetical protein